MIKVSEEMKKEMFNDSKNMWLDSLFYNLTYWYPDISFEEQKETFFSLVKEFLEQGLIKFDTPPLEDFDGPNDGLWDEENDKIFQYLYEGFPKHATDQHDEDVNLYFYVVAPPVNWLQDDGSYGSL